MSIRRSPLVVGYPEDYVKDTGLGLVELQQAGEQLRAHVGDGGAHGMALLAENVVEPGGAALEPEVAYHAELRLALLDEAGEAACRADA